MNRGFGVILWGTLDMIQARNILFQLTGVNLDGFEYKKKKKTNGAVKQKCCDSGLSSQNCLIFELVLLLERDCD